MQDTLSQKVAAFIKEKRQASGMSQAELARITYGNPSLKSYICAIETGKRDILLPTLKNILISLKSDIIFRSREGEEVTGCTNEKAAEFIRTQRLNLGLGQGKLSTLVYGDATSKGNISKIEAGKKQISITTLGYILKALNSDISFLEN